MTETTCPPDRRHWRKDNWHRYANRADERIDDLKYLLTKARQRMCSDHKRLIADIDKALGQEE